MKIDLSKEEIKNILYCIHSVDFLDASDEILFLKLNDYLKKYEDDVIADVEM